MSAKLLQECIDNFGPAPRRFSWWKRWTYLRVKRPRWLNSSDAINVLFGMIPQLFEQGVVVWGQIIQANSMLFDDGRWDHPGEVVFSLKDPLRVTQMDLELAAVSVGMLKGETPDNPALREIADYLTAENIRTFGLQVPAQLSPRIPCQISTTFFVRKHLPKRKLCHGRGFMPFIVYPRKPFVAMPLPSCFWPKELVDNWE